MNIFINGTGFISAAGHNAQQTDYSFVPASEPVSQRNAREPDYAAYIPPMQARRMSKAVRMGIAASKICLDQAPAVTIEAISAGTALGCIQDTETFLTKMIAQEEQMLTPTSFIQSTHNTVAGQIALLLSCKGHNLTFVHKGHSFEHAVLNAQLYLTSHPDAAVLAGGIDELTTGSLTLMQQAGIYTSACISPAAMVQSAASNGTLAGEGAAFFLLSGKPGPASVLRIQQIAFPVLNAQDQAKDALLQFLSDNNREIKDIDLIFSGINEQHPGQPFHHMLSSVFSHSDIALFKPLTGDYATAAAMGLSFLTSCAQNKDFTRLPYFRQQKRTAIRQMLLLHGFQDHYSFWLLEVCQ